MESESRGTDRLFTTVAGRDSTTAKKPCRPAARRLEDTLARAPAGVTGVSASGAEVRA